MIPGGHVCLSAQLHASHEAEQTDGELDYSTAHACKHRELIELSASKSAPSSTSQMHGGCYQFVSSAVTEPQCLSSRSACRSCAVRHHLIRFGASRSCMHSTSRCGSFRFAVIAQQLQMAQMERDRLAAFLGEGDSLMQKKLGTYSRHFHCRILCGIRVTMRPAFQLGHALGWAALLPA